MKDAPRECLESNRPEVTPRKAVEFCLDRLYKDNKHELQEEVVHHLTYEELIGALLLARDTIQELEQLYLEIEGIDPKEYFKT